MTDKNELTELETQEVSIVDKGANRKKRFPLWKSEGVENMELDEIMQAVLTTPAENEEKLEGWIEKAKLDEATVNAAKGALRLLSGHKDKLPSDVLDMLASLAGYPSPGDKKKKMTEDDDYPYPEPKGKEKKSTKKSEENEMSTEANDAMKAQGDALDELRKQNQEIEKQLKVERDMRVEAEWTKKAETELAHFPGKTAAELGRILKALADTNPELAQTQFEAMKSASDLIKSSAILKSAGLPAGPTNVVPSDQSAVEKLNQLTASIIEKSDDLALTPEKAAARILKSAKGAEIYNQYLDENPAQKHFGRSSAK